MRLKLRLIVVLPLAALLGFSSLALLLEYRSSSLAPLQSTPYHAKATYKPLPNLRNSNASRTFLRTLPEEFQQKLMEGLLLDCPSGPQGLLRQKYARFLQTLLDYAEYGIGSSRVLAWQCSVHEHCGGLGDRIRGVAYALLLAIFSRRRLVVFWEAPTEGMYLHPHMIDWRDEHTFEFLRRHGGGANADVPSIDPYIFDLKVILNSAGELVNVASHSDMEYYQRTIASNVSHVVISTNMEPSSLLNPERNGNQEWILAGLKWSGLSHLTPAELNDVVGIVFRYLFSIDKKVLKEMHLATDTLGLGSSPYTALHVRTGFAGIGEYQELARHPKLEHNVSKWHFALDCALDTANRRGNGSRQGNGSVVFLAADSNLVKDIAISKYGHRIRTLRNTLVHVDKLPRDHVLSSTEREGILVTWVEFLLLAQAEVLVRGDSGYSWTAGVLCGPYGNRTVSTNDCTSCLGKEDTPHCGVV